MSILDCIDPKETGLENSEGFWIRYVSKGDEKHLTSAEVILFNRKNEKIDYHAYSGPDILDLPKSKIIDAQLISEMLLKFIRGESEDTELVTWAHKCIFSGQIRKRETRNLLITLARLGASCFKGFELNWRDYENIFKQLGYDLILNAVLLENVTEANTVN